VLQKNIIWSLVKVPEGAEVIECKWVFQFKKNETANINRFKARLGARGFMQEKIVDYSETYAPVAKLTTVWTLLAAGNHTGLKFR
jgi:hypothetical protein